jgi:hypothetical protein
VVDELIETRTIGHDDVILELAWPVMHAATGATGKNEKLHVLKELCELVDAEAKISNNDPMGLPNDGKRATQMLERVLEGGPQFLEQYDDEANFIVMERLNQISEGTLPNDRLKSLEIMLKTIAAVERQQTYVEDNKITFQKYIVLPDSPIWEKREQVKDKIINILQQEQEDSEILNMLWSAFRSMHSNMLSSLRILVDKEDVTKNIEIIRLFKSELKEDLEWAYEALAKKETLSLKEITAARKVWEWHYRFDKDPELKKLAEDLENLYMSNELGREFDPLVNDANWDEHRQLAENKANELAGKDENAITGFVDRAIKFFGNVNKLTEIYRVAYFLGQLAPDKDCITTYVKNILRKGREDTHYIFATYIAGSWVYALREKKEEVLSAIKMLYELPESEEDKVAFIREAYRSYYPDNLTLISDNEFQFLLSTYEVFKKAKKPVEYLQIIGWTFIHSWDSYKSVVETALNNMNEPEKTKGFQALAYSIYHGIRNLVDANKKDLIPVDIGIWLLDLMLKIPEADVVSDVALSHIQMILDHSKRPSIRWLVDALKYRLSFKEQGKGKKIRVIPLRLHLSAYVQPITKNDLANEATHNDIEALLGFICSDNLLGYVFPEYLHDVDPNGVLIPDIVKERFEGLSPENTDDAWKWARIIGQYPMNSEAWRKMAISACKFATRADQETQASIFASMISSDIEAWSGEYGQVPPHFLDAADEAHQTLENETNEHLRHFWEWNHKRAQDNLQYHEERAREVRGE